MELGSPEAIAQVAELKARLKDVLESDESLPSYTSSDTVLLRFIVGDQGNIEYVLKLH